MQLQLLDVPGLLIQPHSPALGSAVCQPIAESLPVAEQKPFLEPVSSKLDSLASFAELLSLHHESHSVKH